MLSSWAYILIGDNNTGKTSFQRNIVNELCNESYVRLPRNVARPINHKAAPRKMETIFTCNRSYQENMSEYKSVDNYFKNFFQDADICILSSHSDEKSYGHIEEMITQLKMRCYNVAGVFFSNGFSEGAKAIALLPWQELLWIENALLEDEDKIAKQLARVARDFSELLIRRSLVQ